MSASLERIEPRITSAFHDVDLRAVPMDQRLARAGSAVQAIVAEALKEATPSRVWYFGSRSRGTARPTSDIDLAFEGVEPRSWLRLWSWIEEEAPTLLSVDAVDMETCPRELRDEVLKTGVLLYERE